MKALLTFLLVGLLTLTFGQKVPEPPFDIRDFSEKMKVSEWLSDYDRVAWLTSDSVMKQDPREIQRLGKEWFCFEQDGKWHAVYGKYDNERFDMVFHFEVDKKGRIDKTSKAVDTSILHRYSRALQTANYQLKTLRDTVNLAFNQYIRENDDKTMSVWIFPAFQQTGYAVYGGEFIYIIDQTGTKILQDNSYFQGEFRGFKVGELKEIRLNYQETTKPTLGTVFFAWYYRSYFSEISIENSASISMLINSESDSTWLHSAR